MVYANTKVATTLAVSDKVYRPRRIIKTDLFVSKTLSENAAVFGRLATLEYGRRISGVQFS